MAGRICWEIEYSWLNGSNSWGIMHVFTDEGIEDEESVVRAEIDKTLSPQASRTKETYAVKSIKRIG